MDLEAKETLHQFVTEWKQELVASGSDHAGQALLCKRTKRIWENKGEESGDEEVNKTAETPSRKRLVHREPSPLLVLPACHGERVVNVPPGGRALRGEEEVAGKTPSLLDTLLADLDDINTIPFFEAKLPREVALLVFSHLSMADLCTCSQVSRSWHSLAEDNVLWCEICQKMGYNAILEDGGHVSWMTVVKEIVLRKKKELKNWKERICGLSDFQPDREGVLLCVDFCPSQLQLIAGYSSGAIYVWTLVSEEGPITLESGHTQLSPPSLCRIYDGWAAVATQNGAVTVYDSCVGSAVHRVDGQGHITCLDLLSSSTHLTLAVACSVVQPRPNGMAPLTMSVMTVLTCQEGRGWHTMVIRPHQESACNSSPINQLSVLENGSALLYSTQTNLSLHPLPSPPSHPHSPTPPPSHILTSAGSAGSTVINCFDHTPQTIACATSAWGYHVQLYDIGTRGHLATLRGHAQPVTSLNIHSSPTNTLVSGSADRRVRVFDTRSAQLVSTLSGHRGTIISTQCDNWKITSGGKDGLVVVWDRRMGGELWSSHERHPVVGCWFNSRYLIAAHLPEKGGVWQQQLDQSEPLHRRHRGLLRVMDFSVDPLYYSHLLPSVCSSGYDEPSRSLHHLDLKLPYDIIR